MDAQAKRLRPAWLQSQWDRKKHDTATRIESAVRSLNKDRVDVTYSTICKRVNALFGCSISANTIKRNEFAYQIYRANSRPTRRTQLRESRLMKLMDGAPDLEKKSLRSKAERLRREPKDALIARVISLERAVAQHKRAENLLRDEILRLAKGGSR
jgi:hypothetical protein